MIDKDFRKQTFEKRERIEELTYQLENTHTAEGSLAKWLRRPESSWNDFDNDLKENFSPAIWEQTEIDIKYEGYIKRQTDMVEKTRRMEEKLIPDWVEYDAITGLKREAQTKLQYIKPKTLGQAGRISGITPADISLLAVWLERGSR